MTFKTLFIIASYIVVILILIFGFFKNISEETERKLMVFCIGLMVVYVLVVGGVYWSDYVDMR
ncbi:MAG: hypothetical protein OEY89_11325 [Gammaproteobacteria bacterium]|nr:hypothetical protein [Gammaproteobacteria bacterium]